LLNEALKIQIEATNKVGSWTVNI